jgi:hypothetical protein
MDKIKDCVTIDQTNLQDEYQRIAADYAYWSEKCSVSQQTYLLRKMERQRMWAQTKIELRETLTMQGERVTEARLDTETEVNDEYCAAKEMEIIAEVDYTKLKGYLEAIKTKREMLISLGAHMRQEMKTI